MQCVLAVDGGNTKTIGLVATLDGTILGAGRGGCGDINNTEDGANWSDSAAAAVARQIVAEHGKALGNYALAGARYVGLEGTAFTLVLAGGVLRHHSLLLADAIIAQVRTTSPQVRPTRYRFEPIIGVLFTALEAAGVAINEIVLGNLIPTIPPPALFATSIQYTDKR